MVFDKVIYDETESKILFHLRLYSDHRNRLYSGLHPKLLANHFQHELFHLKNALIINVEQANRLLEAFALKILKNKEMIPYFYPEYMSSVIGIDTVDRIVWLQYKFNFRPGMVFSPKLCPIQFYYMDQIHKMSKNIIFKTGNPILYEVFKAKYLTNSMVQESFIKSANENDIFLEMEGDEEFDYVLILSEIGSLKMLISI